MLRVRGKLSIPLIIGVIVCIPLVYMTLHYQLGRLNADYVGRIGNSTFAGVEMAVQSAARDASALTSLFTQTDVVRRAYALALSGNIDDAFDPKTQQAREMLRAGLKDSLQSYEAANGAKLKLHFHLPNGRSLVRLWRGKNAQRDGQPADFSDDISGFRSTVMDVNRTGKPAAGLEVGRGGFDVRCVLPVLDANGRQLGSAEVLVEFSSILRGVNTASEQVYVFMNEELLSVAQQLNNAQKHPVYGNFVLVNTPQNEGWKAVVRPEMLAAAREGRAVDAHDAYSTLYYPLRDYKENQIGVIAVAVDTAEEMLVRDSTLYSLLGVTAVMLLVILCIGMLASARAVLRPLDRLLAYCKAVAAGDFTATAGIRTGDEFQALTECVYAMVNMLKDKVAEALERTEDARRQSESARQAMEAAERAREEAEHARARGMLDAAGQLEEVVAVLSAASGQLSAQIVQSESGAVQQASRVAETATAMEEMNSTVLEVARNASAASEASAATRRQAEAGAQVVRKAMEGIQAVREQAQRLKGDMALLGENAQAINQIMGVISDIADQTNLLALNAAIEAARAGEAGRGFAVVADEVRKLAEKTMASTSDVDRAIKAIQASATKSVAQVEASAGSIEEAAAHAGQSGEALGEIVRMVDSTADQVRAIATAAEQQSSTSEEINHSLGQVRDITSETATAMHEAASAVEEMAVQARNLQQLIDRMKHA